MLQAFKTTVKFTGLNGEAQRLHYAVSASGAAEATHEIERRLQGHEIYGYTVESVVAAKPPEAALLNVPDHCVQLLDIQD
jgi:hypothetical protein